MEERSDSKELLLQIIDKQWVTYVEACMIFKCSRMHMQRIVGDDGNNIRWIKPGSKKLIFLPDLDAWCRSTGNYREITERTSTLA